MSAVWTDERVAILKEMVLGGHSYSEIAIRLGGISRNAAIGKALRLGITQSHPRTYRKSARVRKASKPPSGRKLQLHRLSPDQMALARVRVEAFRAEPDLVIPDNQRRRLLDLEPGDCRWPLGDPRTADFHYCNRLQVGTESRSRRGAMTYCEFHAARAYEAPRPRRRAAEPVAAPVREKESA